MSMKLAEIASRIEEHLKRFASDPAVSTGNGITRYWWPGCRSSGRYICVSYISYQGTMNLTRENAETYLNWLDAGQVGKHYAALRDKPVQIDNSTSCPETGQ